MAAFHHGGKDRLLDVNLYAIQISTTRNELIAVYRAAKKVFGVSPELKTIAAACKIKSWDFDNGKH